MMVCNYSMVGPMVDHHRKPLKPMVAWLQNHWIQWLPQTIPFNGYGAFENHWNFAMVAKCGPESPNSFDLSAKCPGNSEMIWGIQLSPFSIIKWICQKMGFLAIASFFRSFKRAKTIVDHRTRIWGTPLKNHRCQWSVSEKTFNGDGSVVAKPLKNHS